MIQLLLSSLDGLTPSVSATTRAPRPGEVDGVHYHFLNVEEFRAAVEAGDFLEWVEYGGNLYGTLRADVERKLADGYDVILEIELQGARAVRCVLPEATQIFIAPPSAEELARRLKGRGTDSPEAIDRRLRIAGGELEAADEFDAVVVNDSAEGAAAEVAGIITKRRKGD